MTDYVPCPGCGAFFPPDEGAVHAYIGASAGCWFVFGEVLAREYSNPRYFRVHAQTVDVYAAQHPGQPERRTIQSVAVHLLALYATFDLGCDTSQVLSLRRKASSDEVMFNWLTPPDHLGKLTVKDVIAAQTADEHADRVNGWGRSVWQAWEPHHAQVSAWAAAFDLT